MKSHASGPLRLAENPQQSRNGRIAQLVEQLTLNQRVLGSNPSVSTKIPNKINGLSENQKPDGA
jgi:hypothetical protein